jgi:hypothetical protein
MSNSSYDENLLIQGSQYTIGTNDGKQFKKVSFVGLRQLNRNESSNAITRGMG